MRLIQKSTDLASSTFDTSSPRKSIEDDESKTNPDARLQTPTSISLLSRDRKSDRSGPYPAFISLSTMSFLRQLAILPVIRAPSSRLSRTRRFISTRAAPPRKYSNLFLYGGTFLAATTLLLGTVHTEANNDLANSEIEADDETISLQPVRYIYLFYLNVLQAIQQLAFNFPKPSRLPPREIPPPCP